MCLWVCVLTSLSTLKLHIFASYLKYHLFFFLAWNAALPYENIKEYYTKVKIVFIQDYDCHKHLRSDGND